MNTDKEASVPSTTKRFKIYDNEYPELLKYPFKSKFKYFQQFIQNINPDAVKEPYIPDFKLKDAKKLSKPNFSNEPGCWELDLMFVDYFDPKDNIEKQQAYLVIINVNTRYLIVEPIENKNKDSLRYALLDAINETLDTESFIKTVKCDGESGLQAFMKDSEYVIFIIETEQSKVAISNIKTCVEIVYDGESIKRKKEIRDAIMNGYDNDSIKDILQHDDLIDEDDEVIEYYPLKLIVNSSPYTLSHKTVDSVIRTLRNAFGYDNRRIADKNLMQQMVNFYNNTPHNKLKFKNYDYYEIDTEPYKGSGLEAPRQSKYVYYTPYQMQNNIDLEWRYIRKMRSKLQEINEKQRYKGLLSYSRGNIILVHLDKGKTDKKFEKRRRVFDDIAEFITYKNGNVICKLLKPYMTFTKIKKDDKVVYESSSKKTVQKSVIEVPIMFTKYVCHSYENLNNDYKQYFGLK